MTTNDIWLPFAEHLPLNKNNGPFRQPVLGWILHCTQSNGRLEKFYQNPATDNCPNGIVYNDGSSVQFAPLNYSPWSQVEGNAQYGAIETEGYGVTVITPVTHEVHEATLISNPALRTLARWHAAYRDHMNVPDRLADQPGQSGIGVHYMGGQAWGGHSCPGQYRAGQRSTIIALSHTASPVPNQPQGDPAMLLIQNADSKLGALIIGPNSGVLVNDPDDYRALDSGGLPSAQISAELFGKINVKIGGMK